MNFVETKKLWIVNKFVSGEYKKHSILRKKFGDSIFNIIFNENSEGVDVYINDTLAGSIGINVDMWEFEMPSEWVSSLFNIINNISQENV